MKLLVILFIMALIGQINIFQHVRQKHGKSVVNIVRALEQVKQRYAKVNKDIRFIKQNLQKRGFISKVAKISLSIRSGSMKLKQKIARLIMEAELK